MSWQSPWGKDREMWAPLVYGMLHKLGHFKKDKFLPGVGLEARG